MKKLIFRNLYENKKKAIEIHVLCTFSTGWRYNNIIYKTAIKPRAYASEEKQERQSKTSKKKKFKTGFSIPAQEISRYKIYLLAFGVKAR